MPLLRISFWGRFALVLCGFAAAGFCLYVMEAVLFYAPAPAAPAFDIAPQYSAAAQAGAAARAKAGAAQRQAEAAAAAERGQRQLALARAGGIGDRDDIQPFFAKADLTRGRRVFSQCAVCHSAAKGGPNRIGPDLWGIAGGAVAARPGMNYSAALRAFGQKQGHWTLAALNQFLYAPAKLVPGTAMSYAGVKNLQDRADLLLYLESLAAAPPKP